MHYCSYDSTGYTFAPTQMRHYGKRYYSAEIGRRINRDPLANWTWAKLPKVAGVETTTLLLNRSINLSVSYG